MIRKTLPPVLVVCLFLVAALAAGPSTAQGRLTDSGGSSRVWGDARSELVDRLFRAVLGRAPGPDEAARAADEVASGRLGELIDTMVASSEYRSRRTGTRQLAERFFRGLFDRSPSSQEAYGLGRDLGGGRDAQAIRRLVDSDEFLTVLEMRPAVAGGPEPAEDERREEDREEGEAERACRAALERRVSQELGRSVGLRLLSAEKPGTDT